MKTIYFIRHGQSEGNVGPIRQDASTPLTKHGELQAAYMAERCAKLPIELLVSSTMKRAKDTAGIIGKKIHREPVFSDLFVERRRPSVQTGVAINDPHSLEVDQILYQNFATPNFRHSDEENFEDLTERARAALDYLASREEEHIAVVTHGFFMRIVMAAAIFRKELTARECELFMRTFLMENTGLTILKSSGEDHEPPWHIWVWNDHAHLG
jgi:broad specificity phosphatase PhoE